jgi:hypothetical protein
MSENQEVTLGRSASTPSTSLAQMLKSQYNSREFHDIFAATELREMECVVTPAAMSSRFVLMIMATTEEDKIGLQGEELKSIEERLAIKRRIEENPCAMGYVIHDSWLYAFGLCRQSLKRQSRGEAVHVAAMPRPVEPVEHLSTKDKLFSKLGISRKYRTEYTEK